MKLADYFERAWVISLPERRDRREQVTAQLEAFGMPLQPGKVEFFDAHRLPDAQGFPSPGAHGCFRSHLAVLERAIAAGCRNVLVFEDDVAFAPGCHAIEEDIARTLSETPWDVAYLGHSNAATHARPSFAPTRQVITGAHCYAVHGDCLVALRDFLRELLDRPPGHPRGGPMHYDGALRTFLVAHPERVALLCDPPLAFQSASKSDIAGGRWFDEVPALAGAVSLVRRLKTRWRQQFEFSRPHS